MKTRTRISTKRRLVLVHNGVIENYATLRDQLEEEGHTFQSQTDTEVLAHLVGANYDAARDKTQAALVEALREALQQVVGTYGIVLIHGDVPDVIVGARRGSPLVLGVGKGENFFASDVSAIVAYTRDAVYLKDYDIAALTSRRVRDHHLSAAPSGFEVSKVEFSAEDVSKGDYPHYMLKEIYEQPEHHPRRHARPAFARGSHRQARRPRDEQRANCGQVERIILTGCGTASHAAMVGEYIIEALAHIPVEIEFASEFRYRNLPLPKDTLVFVHQPERRDRRHARRPAREPAQGPPHPRHLQQRRQHHRPRKRRRRLHARRPGDRRRRRRSPSPRRSPS